VDAGLSELALPVGRGVRTVALRLLDEANAAAPKVVQGDDEEALHDFRVAIRRLRSWIRAFREEFGDSVSKKARRRLKELASATNPARDRQVHREWLRDAAKESRGSRRAAAEWLEQYFDRGDDDDRDALTRVVHNEFPKVRDGLARSLAKDFAVVDGPPDPFAPPPPTLAQAIAERIGPHVQALSEAASHIHSLGDEAAAHAARIAAKQLRYVIEPARDVEGGAALLKRLRGLQNSLGELHDAHVMAHELTGLLVAAAGSEARRASTRALGRELGRAMAEPEPEDARYAKFPRAGVESLMRKLRADISASFAAAAKQYDGEAAKGLTDDGEALTARLRAPHPPAEASPSAGE
jgi:CHAD domain-containing protein